MFTLYSVPNCSETLFKAEYAVSTKCSPLYNPVVDVVANSVVDGVKLLVYIAVPLVTLKPSK